MDKNNFNGHIGFSWSGVIRLNENNLTQSF